jgi:hypothetical protein
MKKKPLTTEVIREKPDNRLKVVSNQQLHRDWLLRQINKEIKQGELNWLNNQKIKVFKL